MKTTNLSTPCALLRGSIALIAALFCVPAFGASQSILLSAESFVILGGTAITSTGVAGTVIENGYVGLSPGATSNITGFPPAIVMGGEILATGPVTGQARLDLIKVATGLAGMPSTTNLSNVDLGGKTLTPGVYTFNGAATLNGALMLDAEGKDNVYWVFQISDTLNTSLNSTVTLINPGPNGGSDVGIFWNAGTAITIGANNDIKGNYLAGTSIIFGGVTSGSARALALAGVSLDNNSIDALAGPGSSGWTGGLTYDSLGKVVALARSLTLTGDVTFGNVVINQVKTQALTLGNTGNTAMTVQSITFPTGFSGNWTSGTIAAGGTQSVDVTFTPTMAQDYEGVITVVADATGGSATITCTGTGSQVIDIYADYEYTDDGDSVTITNYTGIGGVVVIPASINGTSVTAIADSAFSNNSAITSISIPSSVTSIGELAFSNCDGLTTVLIPAAVTSIGNQAFYNCGNLKKVNFAGDAPTTFDTQVFDFTADGFGIQYITDAVGFSSPLWMGYPSSMHITFFYDSDLTLDFGSQWKWNTLFGYIYTGFHPFAYIDPGLHQWIYIAGDSESAGYLYFSFTSERWCYTEPNAYAEHWYYDLTTNEWARLLWVR
ncbi:MAG: ice-binding family protein [Verrucomicrobiota bacterium]|nr:ice-binding family protein [Verrucomicrobiota bacterium]